MTRSAASPPTDPVERVADLLRDVGLAAENARRYRTLATTVAEPAFERALAIGTAIRRALRDPDRQRAEATAAVEDLRAILERSAHAIAALRDSALYREAVAAFEAGQTERVAGLAPALFTDVEPFPDADVLYWPVPIAGGRSAAHFVPPAECAARIVERATLGLVAAAPPPDLGADDHVAAVVLADEHDVAESPVALTIAARDLPAPLCRLAGGNTALFYAPRVHVPVRLRAATAVTDEWWAVRPDAYRTYVEELRRTLDPHGIVVAADD